MAFTANDVKTLREKTGLGMMDCKKAWRRTTATWKAVEWLRKKALAASAKKADRIAAEGIVEAYIHPGGRVGVLVEVNSETDFPWPATRPSSAWCGDRDAHRGRRSRAPLRHQGRGHPGLPGHREAHRHRAGLPPANPANIVERIVEGKMQSIFKEVCLLEQPFIMNPDLTVQRYLPEDRGDRREAQHPPLHELSSWARASRSAARTSPRKPPLPSGILFPAKRGRAVPAAPL